MSILLMAALWILTPVMLLGGIAYGLAGDWSFFWTWVVILSLGWFALSAYLKGWK